MKEAWCAQSDQLFCVSSTCLKLRVKQYKGFIFFNCLPHICSDMLAIIKTSGIEHFYLHPQIATVSLSLFALLCFCNIALFLLCGVTSAFGFQLRMELTY